MDWTKIAIIIPIVKWGKKQFDIDRREKRLAAGKQDVVRREKQLGDLLELKNNNIEKLPDLISLEVSMVRPYLGDAGNTAEIQFLITNRSIFDVTLHKFTVKPSYEARKLGSIQDVEERKISKQAATGFLVTYNLQEPIVKKLEELHQTKSRVYWQFELHGYFHSEVREFEKEQTAMFSIQP